MNKVIWTNKIEKNELEVKFLFRKEIWDLNSTIGTRN